MKRPYKTKRVLVLGAITGPIWQPGFDSCGLEISIELPKAPTFADGLRAILKRKGGDFQSPRFTEDTIIHVERERIVGRSKRSNVRQIPIRKVPGTVDMIAPDTYAADFI